MVLSDRHLNCQVPHNEQRRHLFCLSASTTWPSRPAAGKHRYGESLRCLTAGSRVEVCRMPRSTIHLRASVNLRIPFLQTSLLKASIKPGDGMLLTDVCPASFGGSVGFALPNRSFMKCPHASAWCWQRKDTVLPSALCPSHPGWTPPCLPCRNLCYHKAIQLHSVLFHTVEYISMLN